MFCVEVSISKKHRTLTTGEEGHSLPLDKRPLKSSLSPFPGHRLGPNPWHPSSGIPQQPLHCLLLPTSPQPRPTSKEPPEICPYNRSVMWLPISQQIKLDFCTLFLSSSWLSLQAHYPPFSLGAWFPGTPNGSTFSPALGELPAPPSLPPSPGTLPLILWDPA